MDKDTTSDKINLLSNPGLKESLDKAKKNWDAKAEERRILQETLGAGVRGKIMEIEILGKKLYIVGSQEDDLELERKLGIKFVTRL